MISPMEMIAEENYSEIFKWHWADSPLGFFYIDSSGEVRYMNKRSQEILGIENDSNFVTIKTDELEALIGCGIPDCFDYIKSGNSLNINDHHFINGSNVYRAVNLFCNPFYDRNGQNDGVFTIIQDVTEASREKARLARADYILSIIGQVSEAVSSIAELEDVLKIILIGVTASQGLGFNRAFLFMYNEEENCFEGTLAVGPGSGEEAGQIWSGLENKHKTLLELLDDLMKNELMEYNPLSSLVKGWKIPYGDGGVMRHALEEGRGVNVLGREGRSQETQAILERIKSDYVVAAPIISKGRKLGVILADNRITGRPIDDNMVELLQTFANHTALAIERSQLYDNLRDRAEELEEKNRQLAETQEQMIRAEKMSVIGELTSSIAHELRNPLTVIGGFANMMLATGAPGSDQEYLNIIMTETKRAEAAIHQVLDFSKASKATSREIDFNELVKNTFELLSSRIRFNQRKPGIELSENNASVWGNLEQLMYAMFQFMLLTVEETLGEIGITIVTEYSDKSALMKINFSGSEKNRDHLVKSLSQFFGSTTGTQRLTIIVAGETIRCHGGYYGLECEKDRFPSIYIELPKWEGRGNSGENTDS